WTVGQITVTGAVVVAPAQAVGPAGPYTLRYKVKADDGDDQTGQVAFTMTAASTSTAAPRTPAPAAAAGPSAGPAPSGTAVPPAVAAALFAPGTRANATTTTYQAETGTIFHGTVDSDHAGFTGTGFVNGTNEVGSWVEISINVGTAGSTSLAYRFANGTT